MLNILRYGFMCRALLSIVAMSVFAPILGTFLILRRQSLLSDTLGHVSLAGVALGVLTGVSPTWSTVLVVIVSAVFLEYVSAIYRSFMELGTAILMSAGLAIAMIVMSRTSSSSISLEQYLFGSVVTVNERQVVGLYWMAALVVCFTVLLFRPMYILTFHSDIARAEGMNVRLVSVAFNVLTGIAISLMIPAVGALLVSTIIILPASIALQLGKSFRSVIYAGIGICLLGMTAGLFASYYLRTPASATITMIFIGFFVIAACIRKMKP